MNHATPTPASFGAESEWIRAAEAAVARLARSNRPFTSTDVVRLVGPPPYPSLLSSLFRAAHRRGLIDKDPTAPVGTVWKAAGSSALKTRQGKGRRSEDLPQVSKEVWSEVLKRAKRDKIAAGEVVTRAIREHLKKP